MMDDYRVQEYTLDQGVFRKSSIYEISRTWYHNTNYASRYRRLVILPPDNPYADGLPDVVRSWDEMTALVRKAETAARKREGSAE